VVRPSQPLAARRAQPPARPPALPWQFDVCRPGSLELTCGDDPRGKCALRLGGVLYAKTTRPRDRIGALALRSFIALLFLFYLINLFGPPPPSEKAVALGSLSLWLFVVWAYWLDRHRLLNPSRAALIAIGPLSEHIPAP